MIRPQLVSLQCPQCRARLQAPIFSIIDVSQNPDLKQALLAGQLNSVQCTQCGSVSFLAAPLLYHDPEHAFLGVFLPEQQMRLSEPQRQKAIGDLTKALMDALPAEQRRGYMLAPQQFLTMEKLVEKILGFDGITPEMIAASRRKVELVSELARMKEDSFAFSITVKENEALLDQEFFMLLSNFILAAQQQGAADQAQMLVDLRERLIPLTEVGRRIQKQRDAVQRLGQSPSREMILQALLEGDLDEIDAIAVVARSVLDYQFFQEYSDRIAQAPAEQRPGLEEKRARILAILESLTAADQQVIQGAAQIIQELLGAEDMAAAVADALPLIDETVLNLLLANIEQAQKKGATAAARRLQILWQMITEAMDAATPAPMRLFYELLQTDYPEGTRALLRQRADEITPEFVQFLEDTLTAVAQKEEASPERDQALRHLRNVLTQIKLGV